MTADFNREFIATQDWFFSQLFRDMLAEWYQKRGEQVPADIQRRHGIFDARSTFAGADDRSENPQAEQ